LPGAELGAGLGELLVEPGLASPIDAVDRFGLASLPVQATAVASKPASANHIKPARRCIATIMPQTRSQQTSAVDNYGG
jgi:hypothetical protein